MIGLQGGDDVVGNPMLLSGKPLPRIILRTISRFINAVQGFREGFHSGKRMRDFQADFRENAQPCGGPDKNFEFLLQKTEISC
jgi:hypothetical protein